MKETEAEFLRKAFIGLLASPVVDSRANPDLLTLVRHPRRRQVLTEWFANRLGYQLVVTEAAARVIRTPIGGVALSPRPFDPPPRRVFVLALLAAVAAEDADDVTTTQDLSDRARVLSRHDDVDVASYDPDRYAERLLFIKAVGVLISVGALRPTNKGSADELDDWANNRNAVGAAFEVRRELLLRMVEPTALRAVVAPDRVTDAEPTVVARHLIMRRLIELPALLYEDLSEAEMAYLTSQRSRALDFLSINILDILIRDYAEQALFTEVAVRGAAAEVRARHPKAPTKELSSDSVLGRRALELLCALDLIRPDSAGMWRLMPPAHRFRHPKVLSVTSSQLDLEVQE